MGAISRTYLRDTAVDFSHPYFITKVGFVTKKPSPIPNIKAILWPFGNIVWIALAVSVPAFSFIFWTFSRVDKTGFRSSKYSLTIIFMQISQLLVMQGLDILITDEKGLPTFSCRNKKMALSLEYENSIVVLGFLCIGCGLL